MGGIRNPVNVVSTSPAVNVNTVYGVKADGVTDDSIPWRNAINTEYATAVGNGNNCVLLYSRPGITLVNGSYIQGGATKGNAIIPTPVPATTVQKVNLVISSNGIDASVLPHWQQTVSQKSGLVFRTTRTDGTNDGTFGEASILGGPTPAQGYGFATSVFSNMLLTLDGVSFMAPANPTVCGVDAAGLAQFNFGTLGFMADQYPSIAVIPSNTWQFGVRMPNSNNNDNCNGNLYSCEGAYFGIVTGEHTCITSLRCIYCADGIYFGGGTTFHGTWIGYASIEACAVCLNRSQGNTVDKVCIQNLDYENGSASLAPQAHIYDPGNGFYGYVGLTTNNTPFAPIINGAANLDIQSLQAGKGFVTAPTFPASGTPLVNPFFRDATVIISGGTVTAISVDGSSTGLTSGPIPWPSNKSITVTYTGSPTWKVWLY